MSPNTELQPVGWIIAVDIDDAIRKAESIGERGVVEYLCALPSNLLAGKYMISDNVWMFVD